MNAEEPTDSEASESPGPEKRRTDWAGMDWSSMDWSGKMGSWGKPQSQWLRPGAYNPVGGANAWRPLIERAIALAKTKLLGRELTVRTIKEDLRFTVVELDAAAATSVLSLAQLGDVAATFGEIHWGDLNSDHAAAILRNVHLRGGESPALVAAPIDVTVTLGQVDLDRIVETYRPDVLLEITETDQILARWSRRPGLAHLEVEVGADGTRIWVKPRRLTRGRRSVNLPKWFPPVSFRVPVPEGRLTIFSIAARSGTLELQGRVDQFQIPLGSAGPEGLLRALENLGPLVDITTWPR